MDDVGLLKHDMHASEGPGDLRIAALADRQHDVVAHRQLRALGFGRGAIQHRLRTGRLHRLHLGVYCVGHTRLPTNGRWMAAVLACGPDAVLSHRTAAALWEIHSTARALIDVTAPGRTRHRTDRIVLHRARRLDDADRTVREGIPLTAVSRTLLDLAEVVSSDQLKRAVAQAEHRGAFDLRAVEELVGRSHGRRGLRALTAVLKEHRGPLPVVRSELERGFLDLCRDAGIPPPAVNGSIDGMEVDMAWPDRRLVVELDGHRFHTSRFAFEEDRKRDALLQVAGYRVLRVTHHRLETEPRAVLDAIRLLLATGRSSS